MKTADMPTLSEIKARMAKTNDLFNVEVFGKRNFDALDRIYTSDARILPPGAPMQTGRAAIKEFWSGLVTTANAKSATLTSVEVIPSGEEIVEIGHATLTLAPPGQGETQAEVKYVVLWREEAGEWKWHVDIWNNNA